MLPSKRGGEGERRRDRVRINRLTFYVFKEGRRERERDASSPLYKYIRGFITLFPKKICCTVRATG
jgi:hypothetical protein